MKALIPAEVDLQSPLSAGIQSLSAGCKSSGNAIAGQPLGNEKPPNASEATSSFIPRPIISVQGRQLHQKSAPLQGWGEGLEGTRQSGDGD